MIDFSSVTLHCSLHLCVVRTGESLQNCPYLAVWSLDPVVQMVSSHVLMDAVVHDRSLSRGLPFTCPPPEQYFNPTTYNFGGFKNNLKMRLNGELIKMSYLTISQVVVIIACVLLLAVCPGIACADMPRLVVET